MLNRYRHSAKSRVRLENVKAGGSLELPSVRFRPNVFIFVSSKAQAIELPAIETFPGAVCSQPIELP